MTKWEQLTLAHCIWTAHIAVWMGGTYSPVHPWPSEEYQPTFSPMILHAMKEQGEMN